MKFEKNGTCTIRLDEDQLLLIKNYEMK